MLPRDPRIELHRRRLDAEALEFYQDDTRTVWFAPVVLYPDFEKAAVLLAAELGVSKIRYRGRRTEPLCDHRPDEPHRDNWQGCRMLMEVHVFDLPQTDNPMLEEWRRRPIGAKTKEWQR